MLLVFCGRGIGWFSFLWEIIVSQLHVIPTSGLEKFERNSAVFSNVFQTTLAHDNNEISNCILVPPNKYLFSHEIVHKNLNIKGLCFWNCFGGRSGQGATEIFYLNRVRIFLEFVKHFK